MKPKKQPNGAKKFSRPTIQRFHEDALRGKGYCTLCLPLPTKRAARELLKLLPAIMELLDNPAKKKWEGLSYGEKERVMAKTILDTSEIQFGHKGARAITWESLNPEEILYYLSLARALLALTGEPSP